MIYRVFFTCFLVTFIFQFFTLIPRCLADSTYRVGFHFYKPGDIYTEAYQGIIDGMHIDKIPFEKVEFHSWRKSSKAKENLLQLDKLGLDVIVSFSSAGTRIANNLNLSTPLLASVINHPISLGIEKKTDDSGSHISGTSYYIDAGMQLNLYLKLFPTARRVGMVYDINNPAGYLAEKPMMEKACSNRNLKFFHAGATGRSDIEQATEQLIEQDVEIIIIPTNLQIYSNLNLILAKTNRASIPVLSMNKQGVEAGALAALFADTYKNGRQLAKIIRQVVEKKIHPAEIPFYYSESPDLIINLKSAAELEYEFTPAILGRASIVLN